MWIYIGLALYNVMLGAGALHLAQKRYKEGNIVWCAVWLAFLPLNFFLIVYNLYQAFFR